MRYNQSYWQIPLLYTSDNFNKYKKHRILKRFPDIKHIFEIILQIEKSHLQCSLKLMLKLFIDETQQLVLVYLASGTT